MYACCVLGGFERKEGGGGEDLTVFFVVAQWNSCLSPLLPSPLLLFLSITAGVMRLPWACSATEAQSLWIIIFKIHQQGGGNSQRLEGGGDTPKQRR